MELQNLQAVFSLGFGLHCAFPLIEGLRIKKLSELEKRIVDRQNGMKKSVEHFRKEMKARYAESEAYFDHPDEPTNKSLSNALAILNDVRLQLEYDFGNLEKRVKKYTWVAILVCVFCATGVVLSVFFSHEFISTTQAAMFSVLATVPMLYLYGRTELHTHQLWKRYLIEIEKKSGYHLGEIFWIADSMKDRVPGLEMKLWHR